MERIRVVSSNSLSNLEFTGDSELDTTVSTLSDHGSNIERIDDDAESTSGENNNDDDKESKIIEETKFKRMSHVEWWLIEMVNENKFYGVRGQFSDDDGERNKENDMVVVMDELDEVVVAQDNAERDRLFWDACIAHGY